MNLAEFQQKILLKKYPLQEPKTMYVSFDSDNGRVSINANDILFLSKTTNYDKVSFSKEYIIGYHYFNNKFYTIIDKTPSNKKETDEPCILITRKEHLSILVHNITISDVLDGELYE